MEFKEVIENVEKNPRCLIKISHPVIDNYMHTDNKYVSKKHLDSLKEDLDGGMNLSDLLCMLGNDFVPKDISKILKEGNFNIV